MTIGSRLRQATAKEWESVQSIGFNRVKDNFKTRESANELIKNQLLQGLGLKEYIPLNSTKKGVLRMFKL